MVKSEVKNLSKATVEINITISWDEIKDLYEKIVAAATKEIEIEGFRKGKAPKELAEKQISKEKAYEQIIKEKIPQVYAKAIEENKIFSVGNPKIEIIKSKENEDWQIKVTIALKPIINLNQYKEKIKEFKQGKAKIWLPGQNENEKEKSKPSLDEIIKVLIDEVRIEISDLLIEDETNRLLSNLIDQTHKLGLTIDQYLMAKGKTSEKIKEEYKQDALRNLTLEFALAEIADTEKIEVSEEDINKLLEKIEEPEEREKAKKDIYYLAHLIRQQKTLDLLHNL